MYAAIQQLTDKMSLNTDPEWLEPQVNHLQNTT